VFRELLQRHCSGFASISTGQAEALQAHYELLQRWNRVLNLTTVTSEEEAVERHYCESLFLAARLPQAALQIIDIGSGGGFPGIPVAVMRPDCSVTLLEAHARKAVFLREATRGISNARVRAERGEVVAGAFDHAICRAVSYRDLEPFLKKIAAAAGLLTGIEEPPASLGFEWQETIQLPWGRGRFLRMGIRREGAFHP
jgi:16S rRNA (guanine527-N7)-methyltransferase